MYSKAELDRWLEAIDAAPVCPIHHRRDLEVCPEPGCYVVECMACPGGGCQCWNDE